MTDEQIAAASIPIDADIETYAPPEERMRDLRHDLEKIKSLRWLGDLFDWVKEKGSEVILGEEPDLIEENKAKRLVLGDIELFLSGIDLSIAVSQQTVVVLQRLPKGDEVLIVELRPEGVEKLFAVQDAIQTELKAFYKEKADRTKEFQEKFLARKKGMPEPGSEPAP